MTSMTDVKCICGTVFQARTADVNRGWGKFCSKSCKAHKQAKDTGIDGPDHRAGGKNVKQMRNGEYAKSKFKSKGAAPWVLAGVSKETFMHYADEYGGTPVFNSRGEYAGFIPTPFDNTTHQNHEPND